MFICLKQMDLSNKRKSMTKLHQTPSHDLFCETINEHIHKMYRCELELQMPACCVHLFYVVYVQWLHSLGKITDQIVRTLGIRTPCVHRLQLQR